MASPPPRADLGGDDPRAAAWDWLATLPRPAVPHDRRGPDPLAGMRALLAALEHPERDLRVIHVVGSKGKGSTVLLIEALLRALGQRTLAFTSPHLEQWTERIRIDGREIDGATGLAAVRAVAGAAAASGVRPGFFEALVAAALHLGRDRNVDWCIVEAGVGARADATNVVEPRLVVVTSLEREHEDRLGTGLAAIAREKAGAIKPGAGVILPELPAEAAPAFDAALAAAGVSAVHVHRAGHPPATGTRPVATRIRWRRQAERLELDDAATSLRLPCPWPGAAMAGNAALAGAAVQALGIASREDLGRAGRSWRGLELPGRSETLSTLPWLMVDTAHTEASMRELAQTVCRLAPARLTLVLSLSGSRELAALTEPVVALADRVVATRADADYSLDPALIARALAARWPELEITAMEDPERALAGACTAPAADRLILATGSTYLAGRVRALARAGEASTGSD